MVQVGAHIKRLRAERGWSQPQLAVEAGVAVSAVSQIENGRRSPNVSTLDKIAGAFGVEVADFFPKGPRSSLELPLFNGSDGERPSRFAKAIALVADKWGVAVTSTLTNDNKRFGIMEAAIDLSDAINESVENWSMLSHQDQVEILTAMEKLREVAERGLKHLEKSAQNQAEEETLNERREQIRRWTEQISA